VVHDQPERPQLVDLAPRVDASGGRQKLVEHDRIDGAVDFAQLRNAAPRIEDAVRQIRTASATQKGRDRNGLHFVHCDTAKINRIPRGFFDILLSVYIALSLAQDIIERTY
jgi:hypothetical protein